MHPLLRQLHTVRRRVRGLLVLHALAWMLAAVLTVVAVLSTLDFLVHFEDRGIRIMCTLAVVTTGALLAYRLLWPAIVTRFSDVTLALRVEERFPEFSDQLASTVQFLHQRSDDPEAGSAMLRREVIHQTAAEIGHVDVSEVVDVRPTVRAVVAAVAAIAVFVAAALWSPQAFATALLRLSAPLGNAAWPKMNNLVIANPDSRLAVGEPFEVEVSDVNGARLPAEVRIHFRYEGDPASTPERVEPMRPARGVMVANIEGVSRPFKYRAEGGDDDSMPWYDLEVVEPPVVEQLEATLHYPAYTGWPPTASEAHVRAIIGTRVALAGRTNKPIAEAVLHIEGEPDIAATVAADGLAFTISADAEPGFVVRKSGFFTFDLVDREGFHGPRDIRYEVRAVEDRAPTVSFEEPAADIYVTADAVVPVRVLAKDDLAIQRVDLNFSRSDESEQPEQKLPLYQGPEVVEPPAEGIENGRGESRTLEHRWDLAPLGLKPGARITAYALVADYRPVETKSHPRRLSIITRDELQDRLTERQGAILTELSRLLKLEQQSRAQVSGLEIQLDQVGKLSKQDIDHLQQAELTQRQVERGLGHRNEGVPAQISSLLSELKNNKVDSSDVERRLTEVMDELERVGREHLPVVARDLTAALKTAQDAAKSAPEKPSTVEGPSTPDQQATEKPAGPDAAPSLAEAGKHQDATIQSLEQLLSSLTEWDNYRRFHRDIGQLRRDQEELARDTAEQGNRTLTQDVKDLKPQQQADLRKLGSRQSDLARNFEKIQQRMEEMAKELRETDPLAADTIADALHAAREKTLGGQMREAGRELEQNQLGQAAKAQQQSMRTLDELLDILSNKRERELGRLVKKLRDAEQQLDKLQKEQEGLKKKLQDVAKKPDDAEKKRELERLTKQQKQLEEEIQRFARSLKRLQADQAGRTADRAGGKAGSAAEAGEQGDAAGAAEQAEAAEQDLQDAQQQLAEQRKKAEADLAQEQLARMEDTLNGLRQQQEKLLTETKHYDQLARDTGGLRRAQLLSLRDVAQGQRSLSGDVEALAGKLSKAGGAFELALKAAARTMTQAAERLDDRDTGNITQSRQQQAIERLAQMLKAFERGNKKQKEQKQQAGGDQGGQGGEQGQNEPSAGVAELRLIKLLQESINDRVRQLFDGTKGRDLTPAEQEEYADLSGQQADLADLLLELSKPKDDSRKDDAEFKKLLDPDAGRSRDTKLPEPE